MTRSQQGRAGRSSRCAPPLVLLIGLAASCSGTQPNGETGKAWDIPEPKVPDVIYWDESMSIDLYVEKSGASCLDWPLVVAVDGGPLETGSELWEQGELWISPGAGFATPTRHFFRCSRPVRNGIRSQSRVYDTGEYVFTCSGGGAIWVHVRSTYPPLVDPDSPHPQYEELPLPEKYDAMVPNCRRFLMTIELDDGSQLEVPYGFTGGRGRPRAPADCWHGSTYFLNPERDQQLNPEGGECTTGAN